MMEDFSGSLLAPFEVVNSCDGRMPNDVEFLFSSLFLSAHSSGLPFAPLSLAAQIWKITVWCFGFVKMRWCLFVTKFLFPARALHIKNCRRKLRL